MTSDKIPAYSAKWLVRQILFRGFPLKRILKDTDLSEAWLRDDSALISQSSYLTVVNNALDITGDPALALNLGRQTNLGELGIWGYAIISSPTLGEANQVAMQYWELNGPLVTLFYRQEGDCSTWEIRPAFPMDSLRTWMFAVEELLATFFSGAWFISNQDLQIEEIRLSYPEPAHGALYAKMFKCPVHFDKETDLFRVSWPFKNVPTAMGNPQLAAICREQCRELMARLEGSGELIGSIHDAIIASLGRFPRLEEIARQLAMSPRTLRRRLRERNTTYQNILDELRSELVKQYLTTTNLSVDQIASRIGYSEGTTLRRAFKKWTGMNVKEFKRLARP